MTILETSENPCKVICAQIYFIIFRTLYVWKKIWVKNEDSRDFCMQNVK